MSQTERIQVDDAPTPKGAYSQVVRAGDLLFVSGRAPSILIHRSLSLATFAQRRS